MSSHNQRPMGHNGSPERTAIKSEISILAFQGQWKQIKMSNLHKTFMLRGGLLIKRF